MLKKAEVSTLLGYLAGAFPGKLKYPTGSTTADDAMVLAYQRALGEVSANVALAAVDMYSSRGEKWPPSAGELASEARKLVDSRSDRNGLEGWEELRRAFALHSPFYQYAEFIESLSEEVRETVRKIGIDTIDKTDPAFMQPSFVKLFEEQQKRKREQDQIMETRDRLLEGKTDKHVLSYGCIVED